MKNEITVGQFLEMMENSVWKALSDKSALYDHYYNRIEGLLHGLRKDIVIRDLDSLEGLTKEDAFDSFVRDKTAKEIDKRFYAISLEIGTWKKRMMETVEQQGQSAIRKKRGIAGIIAIAQTRKAEEAKKAEAARKEEEAKKAEAARKAEEAKRAEAARKEEEAKKAEAARKEEEAKRAEAARKAEEAKKAEVLVQKPWLSPDYPTLEHYDKAEFQIEGTTLIRYNGRSVFKRRSEPIGSAKVAKVPRGVTSIGKSAFSFCDITDVTIPDGVTTIGERAFRGCSNLTGLRIPNSVTSIGAGAFSCCENLTSIQIPESVISIGEYAFGACKNLKSIRIPESVTTIGKGAFHICGGLKSIRIPDSVTSIEASAFNGCNGLTGIEIPEGVTSIGGWAFSGCESLTKIQIPASVTLIEWRAFFGCRNLEEILYGGTTKEWKRLRKDSGWNEDTGDYTVRCTDGTVAKDGTLKRGFGLRSLFKKPRNE